MPPGDIVAASTSLTQAQRIMRARIAANTRWSTSGASTVQADKRLARYAAEVDPGGKLPEAERLALARKRRRAHMQRMALASSKARAARKAGGEPDAA
jgi:hypothetical protein